MSDNPDSSRQYFHHYAPEGSVAVYQPAWTDLIKLVGLTQNRNLFFILGSGDLDQDPQKMLAALQPAIAEQNGQLSTRGETTYHTKGIPPRAMLNLLGQAGLLQPYDFRNAVQKLMKVNPRKVETWSDRFLSIPNGPVRTLSLIGEHQDLFIRVRPSSSMERFHDNYVAIASALIDMNIKPIDHMAAWDFKQFDVQQYINELQNQKESWAGLLKPHSSSIPEIGTVISLASTGVDSALPRGNRVIAGLCQKQLMSPLDVRAAIDVFDLEISPLRPFITNTGKGWSR